MRNVLFLCTGNSARSILAEAILARDGVGRFYAFSAGSQPKGAVHLQALRLLKKLGVDTTGFRSKSWDEFTLDGAPELDLIITVCDNAAGEVCPIWPGKPISAHWGVPDPAAATGADAEVEAAFARAYDQLHARIHAFLQLPSDLDDETLTQRLRAIGEMPL